MSDKPIFIYYRSAGVGKNNIACGIFHQGWIKSVNNNYKPIVEFPLTAREAEMTLDALKKRYPLPELRRDD